MKKKQQKNPILWRGLDFFFPSFSELQFMVMFSIIVTIALTNQEARHELTDVENVGILLLFPMLLFIFVMLIFIKEKLDNSTKEFLFAVYYGFVAVMAGVSLRNHTGSIEKLTPIERVNLAIIGLLFITATIRLIFAWFLNDGEATTMDKAIGRNFKEDQYRYSVHIAAVLLAAAGVVGLSQMYKSTATVAALTFGYMGMLLSVLNTKFKPRLIQTRDKS
jgi:hypothetical protein